MIKLDMQLARMPVGSRGGAVILAALLAMLAATAATGIWPGPARAGQAGDRTMERNDANGQDAERLTIADLLDRIERFRKASDQAAALWKSGLTGGASPLARLDLSLLEIYGPESVRDAESARRRLEGLRPALALDDDAHRLFELLRAHLETLHACESELQSTQEALDEERRSHEANLERLDSLRRIERQMESSRDGNGDVEDNDP